ncbi:hypothetical protein GCM10025778_26380 [Paeniglutamicibacter antarcticus]|uniref:Uncharacterized protein n=1 Tax=Paeniglutamicibacter antarcticus TaxID=494023 RepID=A0ABP9TPI3_9MICC
MAMKIFRSARFCPHGIRRCFGNAPVQAGRDSFLQGSRVVLALGYPDLEIPKRPVNSKTMIPALDPWQRLHRW